MSEYFECYRCGAPLAALPPPWSRQEQCPNCHGWLHCCRLCEFFDAAVAEQCREEDADDVRDKEGANFCDYFRPRPGAHDDGRARAATTARARLDALFDDGPSADGDDDDASSDAEGLFR